MSTFTKFAVVGAGGVGSSVVDGLLKANAIVTILTRDDTKPELQTFKERGASIVKANYDDEASLQGALADSEVVVCTVDARHHAVQFGIARAAKAAGVQLFVPTEFGMPDEDGANITKQKVRGMLKELDLPYALFFSGFWFEYLPLGVMSVIGEGNAKLGLVSRTDFGRFVAHVLVTVPKASLEWAQFSIESNRMSPKEIAAMAEKKFGKKIELKVVDYEATKKNYDTDSVAYILTRIGDGRCVPGTEEEVKKTVSKFFPDWNPTLYEV
ncbi:Eugenol synthase 1 [Phytophthora cinnamomi]|uniref:Eugenol synthase 1 n=1 Tax=Phytophthora cinnamomi TaxID=4785 RepID=UPI003559C2BF|nr:Eugenol synthase 1 [Phytophthora cinnamomi]